MKNIIVSFDFWDTLVKNVSYRKQRLQIIKEFLGKKGFQVSETEVREAYGLIHNRIHENKKNCPNMFTCLEERMEVVLGQLSITYDDEMIHQLIEELQHPVLNSPPPLTPYAKELLEELKDRAYLVCTSDTGMTNGHTVRKILAYYGIDRYFDFFVFSEDVGFNKPDRRMFSTIRNISADIPQDQIYHIGDKYETDILGAFTTGICPIWFQEGLKEVKQANDVNCCIITSLAALMKGVVDN